MTPPFFSIITPTYNSSRFLTPHLDSVAGQSFTDYEHIFIDANSTDGTNELLTAYRRLQGSRVKIFHLPPEGIAAAMNAGISKARGRFLLFLHSDDALFDSRVLGQVFQFLKGHPRLDWIYGQIQTVDVNNRPLGVFPRQRVFQLASPVLLKYINFVPHQASFVRRKLFFRFGVFPTLPNKMELDFWLRIRNRTSWQYLPLIISRYRLSATADSSSQLHRRRNLLLLFQVQKKYSHIWEYPFLWLVNHALDLVNRTYRS